MPSWHSASRVQGRGAEAQAGACRGFHAHAGPLGCHLTSWSAAYQVLDWKLVEESDTLLLRCVQPATVPVLLCH